MVQIRKNLFLRFLGLKNLNIRFKRVPRESLLLQRVEFHHINRLFIVLNIKLSFYYGILIYDQELTLLIKKFQTSKFYTIFFHCLYLYIFNSESFQGCH